LFTLQEVEEMEKVFFGPVDKLWEIVICRGPWGVVRQKMRKEKAWGSLSRS